MWTYWWSYLIVVPGILLSVYAQSLISNRYKQYSKISAKSGWTAEMVAQRLLQQNDCNVRITSIRGNLTDNYNPSKKVLSLSQSVYGKSNIAALGVAAHEVGHAVQDRKNYFPLRLRAFLVPAVNLGTSLAVPLLLLGIVLDVFIQNAAWADFFITLAIISYSLATVFALITLPVEFNASRRALNMLKTSGTLDEGELAGAQKVLSAAAMTYVASMLTSLLYLIRFIFIASRFKRR